MRGLSNALLLSLPAVTLAAKTLQLNNKIFGEFAFWTSCVFLVSGNSC